MVDRPVFAFEDSFLDGLAKSYDMTLDPTSFASPSIQFGEIPESANTNARPESIHQNCATSISRENSTGSKPGSLWFLKIRSGRGSQRDMTCCPLRNTSLGSVFSLQSPMHSLDSLTSLASPNANLNSFGLMTSLDSIKSESAMLREILSSPTKHLTRQVTPAKNSHPPEVPQPKPLLEETHSMKTAAPKKMPKTAPKKRKRKAKAKVVPKKKVAATKSKAMPRVIARKASQPSLESSSGRKRRIRRKEPVVREYVFKTDNDILLGRGGGSNHHQGNILYRKRILSLQPEYKRLDRDDKTALSEKVVEWVYKRNGRFLKRECKGSPWYHVTKETARQKVSQA